MRGVLQLVLLVAAVVVTILTFDAVFLERRVGGETVLVMLVWSLFILSLYERERVP